MTDPSKRARPWLGLGLACALAGAAPVSLAEPVDPARSRVTRERVAPPAPLDLAWCLARAADANPAIAASRASAVAARERSVSSGALEDPQLSYEASNLPTGEWDFDSSPLSGHQLGLKQKLPFPGLLGGREEAARARARAAELSLADRRLAVAGAVEATWSELGFAQRALDITDRNVELLRQLTKIAETKYRVGRGLQQDVLRAQVELTARLEERLRRSAAVASASARLAALLDLPPGVQLPRTASLEDPGALPPLAGLVDQLERSSPELRARDQAIESARREVRVAELEGYPDIELGLGYRVREDVDGDPVNGRDFFGAGVTIRLPVDRRKWRSKVAERAALLRREEAGYRTARAELRARIRTLHAELERADAEAQLLETGLVPQARQSFEASRSGYEVGRIDFLALLDSQVRLQNAELRRVRAVADRRVAFAALEAATGRSLR